MKIPFMALAALALTGCIAQQEITTAPVDVKYQQGFDQANLRSIDATEIRTYTLDDPAKKREEIVNSTCVIQGSGYVGEFQTPAIVRLPNMGKTTPPISLSCQNGEKVASTRIEIKNISAEQRLERSRQSSSQLGLIGAVVGELAAAAMDITADRPGDRFGYSDQLWLDFKSY